MNTSETTLIYSPQMTDYDFGPGHPFHGARYDSFFKLFDTTFPDHPAFKKKIHDRSATDEELRLWHTDDYINILRAASIALDDPFENPDWQSGPHINIDSCGPKQGPSRQSLSVYLSDDMLTPGTGMIPLGLEPAARAAVKSSLLAVDEVMTGRSQKAVNIGGGLHHAMPAYGEGFCLFNDVVIATRYALEHYNLDRILVLDTDAHAGNGTFRAFYDDPRVLFIDTHQHGIYPGTGMIDEIGTGPGTGCTINIPLPAGTGDDACDTIFHDLIIPLAAEFRPQLIVRNGGSDPHFSDGLADLGLSLQGFALIARHVRKLAADHCDGRTIDLICSGYNPEILPQAWLTHLAALTGLDTDFPQNESIPASLTTASFDPTPLITDLKSRLAPHWQCAR